MIEMKATRINVCPLKHLLQMAKFAYFTFVNTVIKLDLIIVIHKLIDMANTRICASTLFYSCIDIEFIKDSNLYSDKYIYSKYK